MLSDTKDSVIYDQRWRIITDENYILITQIALSSSSSFPLDLILNKGDIKSKVGLVSWMPVRCETPIGSQGGLII